MANIEKPFTLGEWLVKEGREPEFISYWQTFAEQTAQDFKTPGGAYLLQDSSDPRHFISFGEWEKDDTIRQWRQSPEFSSFITNVKPLCETIEPYSMKVVAVVEGAHKTAAQRKRKK